MNNDTNIKSMPDINASMTFDVDSQALISAISTAISNGFENLNSLQVDAVTQIEENKNNIETNAQDIETNTQDIATNRQNIATNTQDIATNTQNISTNVQNIATNTQDIASINNTLNNMLKEETITFSSNNPCTLNVSNYWRGEIVLIGGSANFMGVYFSRVSSTGSPYIYALKDSPVTTITTSTNKIVLSSNDYCGGYVKTVNGTCTVS